MKNELRDSLEVRKNDKNLRVIPEEVDELTSAEENEGNERKTYTLAFFSEKVLNRNLDIVKSNVSSSGSSGVCKRAGIQWISRECESEAKSEVLTGSLDELGFDAFLTRDKKHRETISSVDTG